MTTGRSGPSDTSEAVEALLVEAHRRMTPLRVQGARLDRGYLERGARELGVEGLLAEALAEARIEPPR